MKILSKTILLSLLVLSSILPAAAQPPREIVDKCITTLGGEEGIRNFSNFKATGDIHFFFGVRSFKGDVTVINKGKKSFMQGELTIGSNKMKVVRSFDGKRAWMERRGTISDQPILNYQSELDHTPLLLLEKEAVLSLKERTEIEGNTVIGIEVAYNNKKTIFFIDQTEHTLKEIKYSDLFFGDSHTKETFEKRIRYHDYKKIKGFMFPSRITVYQKGKKQMELNFQEVLFNPKVAPDIFERPDQELDLRTREEHYH